ncbi:MAG: endolytic transglycosylase MltG [Lewinellaceae bacterium]|nr:endolytic transglycosylase MltG [Lewinellaceae bacterium]
MKSASRLSVLLALAFLVLVGTFLYRRLFVGAILPNTGEEVFVKIPTNSTFEEVVTLLSAQGIIKDEALFRRLADYMKYPRDPMRAGRYKVEPGMTTVELIRLLRSGPQSPVRVVLNNERLIEEVAAKVAGFLEPDSLTLLNLLTDADYLAKIGYTPDNLMTIFIPNTYEFFWNTSPEQFMDRMIREHKAFWDKNSRLDKAKKLGLSPEEVYTLASIVEKETLRNDEKPRIAGAYLNRLRIGMRLQADPTAVFARRDFTTGRVTEFHTKFDSPYNTYLYAGLPPGPIAMASISSIDAVLNPENHQYIYFCALGDGTGYHAFAESYNQHLRNVARYKENLKERGLL